MIYPRKWTKKHKTLFLLLDVYMTDLRVNRLIYFQPLWYMIFQIITGLGKQQWRNQIFSFCPIVSFKTLCALLGLHIKRDWDVTQLVVNIAFEVYMEQINIFLFAQCTWTMWNEFAEDKQWLRRSHTCFGYTKASKALWMEKVFIDVKQICKLWSPT